MQEQYSIPVAIVVFNRISMAEKLFRVLEKVRPSKLFVISDGARKYVSGEEERVKKVRSLFEHVSWPCEVFKDYADENMGCDLRVPRGLDWVFRYVDYAVILEDDCIPSMQFFLYAKDMLMKYQDDPKVMMVAGSNMVSSYRIQNSCCFTARTYTWGWATWKRAWDHYCGDDSEWKRIRREGILRKTYGMRSRYYICRELNYYFKKGQCPWDYLWWITCIGAGGLCAVPKVNLIKNEGFGSEATHTHEKGSYNGETGVLQFPLQYPEHVVRDYEFDRYDSGVNPPWKIVRIYRKIRKWLRG